ncbi:MAG: metallophosphoesterase [Desulfomonile tiedjei]|nr:metallophosphoesterase [Desulfomonile tiedjei]
MKALFSWVHLSDIHAGCRSENERLEQESALTALIKDLQPLPSGLDRVDAILVTGDIGATGGVKNRTEYKDAAAWLRRVADGLDLRNPNNVFLVPGNHDIDRSVAESGVPKPLLNNMRKGSRPVADVFPASPLSGITTDSLLLRARLSRFESLASKFHRARPSRCDLCWWHRPQVQGQTSVRLVGLDTALLAQNDADRGRLRVGLQQVYLTLRSPVENATRECVLVLGHHPLSWLADRDVVEAELSHGAHAYFCGHLHEPDDRHTVRGHGGQLLEIVAGAVYAKRRDRKYCFSFGALFERKKDLRLRVWPRKFIAGNRREYVTDTDYTLRSHEYYEHTIRLHGVNLAPDRRRRRDSPTAVTKQTILQKYVIGNTPASIQEHYRTRIPTATSGDELLETSLQEAPAAVAVGRQPEVTAELPDLLTENQLRLIQSVKPSTLTIGDIYLDVLIEDMVALTGSQCGQHLRHYILLNHEPTTVTQNNY